MADAHEQIDLAYRLLDLDLVDSEGIRCGKVDDLVLTGEPGELCYVAAVRSGTGALPGRFARPLQRLAKKLFRGDSIDIPSKLVDDFHATVTLNATAPELGLGAGDRQLAALFGVGAGEE